MSRASDIAAIVRALDRAQESDDWHREGSREGSMVAITASVILEYGEHAERFTVDAGRWTNAGIRAATIAYATNAPAAVLCTLAWWARREHQWIEWWDREGWLESEGWIPLPWCDERRATRPRAA